jgi:choline-sulfatase
VVEGAQSNILIYLIDTLRRDRLGCYGYSRPTSPRIDAFAAKAVVFEDAIAQSPWTRSSVASIFTGLWPQVHGANHDDEKLGSTMPTLAELLTRAGYQSLGLTANGNVSRAFGFDRGFERYAYLAHSEGAEVAFDSREVNTKVFELLDQRSADRPFFLYVHTVDPHAPYDPPEPFRSALAGADPRNRFASVAGLVELEGWVEPVEPQIPQALLRLYDAEIAANDASFGALLDELERRGLYDNTLIIFVSDHGEEFFEHQDWTHGKHLYSEVIDIPLIIKPPGSMPARRVANLAQHVDLMPTVLDVIGQPLPAGLQGRSLRPFLGSSVAANITWPNHALFHLDLRGRLITGLIDGRYKLIQRRPDLDAFPELYDRVVDRPNRDNLAPRLPEIARRLAYLRRLEEARIAAHAAEGIDPANLQEVEAGLRALGYLQ